MEHKEQNRCSNMPIFPNKSELRYIQNNSFSLFLKQLVCFTYTFQSKPTKPIVKGQFRQSLPITFVAIYLFYCKPSQLVAAPGFQVRGAASNAAFWRITTHLTKSSLWGMKWRNEDIISTEKSLECLSLFLIFTWSHNLFLIYRSHGKTVLNTGLQISGIPF